MYLFGEIFGGRLLVRFKCGQMAWPSHRKKKFFVNNSVNLSMRYCPIETVKYIWVNIWCILDWILSQNCRNTLPLHATVEQLGVEKLKTLLCLTNSLQPTLTLLLTRWEYKKRVNKKYKKSSLAVTLHCLNSFQHKNYVVF